MEVEINKEILSYREAVWFGMSMKEICSVIIAMIFSAIAYFTTGAAIVCVGVSVVPILAGFYQYHGMGGGSFLRTVCRDSLRPRRLVASRTVLFEQLREVEAHGKRRYRKRAPETPAKERGGNE